jgi:hypothetical protein
MALTPANPPFAPSRLRIGADPDVVKHYLQVASVQGFGQPLQLLPWQTFRMKGIGGELKADGIAWRE